MGEIDILFDEAAQKSETGSDSDDAVEEPDLSAPVVSKAGDLWRLV